MIREATYTSAERDAFTLLTVCGVIPMATNDWRDPHWAGDYILQLAARIQGERASAALDPQAGCVMRVRCVINEEKP
jgi:hypothetical protein